MKIKEYTRNKLARVVTSVCSIVNYKVQIKGSDAKLKFENWVKNLGNEGKQG